MLSSQSLRQALHPQANLVKSSLDASKKLTRENFFGWRLALMRLCLTKSSAALFGHFLTFAKYFSEYQIV